MKILRVFLKNHNGAWVDMPSPLEQLNMILANWKINGTLIYQDNQSLPLAVQWDAWSFCCLLTVGEQDQVPAGQAGLASIFGRKPN